MLLPPCDIRPLIPRRHQCSSMGHADASRQTRKRTVGCCRVHVEKYFHLRYPKLRNQEETMPIDPELGFTADVIRDPSRFVGRTELIRDCMLAINAPTGLISVYGKRGVGKSSLLRQIQQMALGEYTLAKRAGLSHLIPITPRTYLTVYYSCDSLIADGRDLLSRLCNDQSAEDSLLRLVPDEGEGDS